VEEGVVLRRGSLVFCPFGGEEYCGDWCPPPSVPNLHQHPPWHWRSSVKLQARHSPEQVAIFSLPPSRSLPHPASLSLSSLLLRWAGGGRSGRRRGHRRSWAAVEAGVLTGFQFGRPGLGFGVPWGLKFSMLTGPRRGGGGRVGGPAVEESQLSSHHQKRRNQ
jgi:hypothetical protein